MWCICGVNNFEMMERWNVFCWKVHLYSTYSNQSTKCFPKEKKKDSRKRKTSTHAANLPKLNNLYEVATFILWVSWSCCHSSLCSLTHTSAFLLYYNRATKMINGKMKFPGQNNPAVISKLVLVYINFHWLYTQLILITFPSPV